MSEVKSPKQLERDHKFFQQLAGAGFILWFAIILAGAFAPDGMDIAIIACAALMFGVYLAVLYFRNGYYQAALRKNYRPLTRKDIVIQIVMFPLMAAMFGGMIMLFNGDPWQTAMANGLVFSTLMTSTHWFFHWRKPKDYESSRESRS